jgi:hypothetical protein
MRKPIVYLPNNNKGLDTSAASVYGDIVTLYPNQTPNVFQTASQAFHLRNLLKDAVSSDYLMVGGNALLLLLVFGILYERFGFVNVLLYDMKNNEYHPRVIPRHQLQTNKEEK